MPHSSGGRGFHGGGFHGGSRGRYHSGRAAGGGLGATAGVVTKPTVKKEPFEGASKFAYYRRKTPHYFYADFLPASSYNVSWKSLVAWILIVNFVFYVFGFLFGGLYRHPTKLETDSQVHYIIDDKQGDITNDRDRLEADLEAFYQKTGIVPAIVTVDLFTFLRFGSGGSTEEYAREMYFKMFDDESHWLIVYGGTSNTGITHFIGMQGNDTDKILYKELTEEFNSALDNYLGKLDFHTTGEAFSLAFEAIEPKLMESGFNIRVLSGISVLAGVITIALGIIAIASYMEEKYKKAFKVDENMKEISCFYCGGTYIEGVDESCPFCKETDSL